MTWLATSQAAPRVHAQVCAFAQRPERLREGPGDGRTVANSGLCTIPHLDFRCGKVGSCARYRSLPATVGSAMRDVQPWRVLGSRRETDLGLVACNRRVATNDASLSTQLSLKYTKRSLRVFAAPGI